LCHLPFNINSEYEDRRGKYEISLHEIETFCEKFKGVGDSGKGLHRLTGGEFTALPIEKIENIIETLHQYNRKVWIMSNGYNIMEINPEILKDVSKITLDNHGINAEALKKCREYLQKIKKGKFFPHIKSTKRHYNLEADRETAIEDKGCHRWMRAPTYFKGVFYPCCSLPCLDMFDKSTLIKDSMIDAGWTLDNSDIVETMKEWKTTIPSYVIDQCLNSCWEPQPDKKKRNRYLITLKPNDVIMK